MRNQNSKCEEAKIPNEETKIPNVRKTKFKISGSKNSKCEEANIPNVRKWKLQMWGSKNYKCEFFLLDIMNFLMLPLKHLEKEVLAISFNFFQIFQILSKFIWWNKITRIFERILKEIARPSFFQEYKCKHFYLKHPSKATYRYMMDTLSGPHQCIN